MFQIKGIKRVDEAQEIARLKRKIKKLEKLNSFYIDILGLVSHEFKDYLSSISGWANVLEDKTRGHLNKKATRALQYMNKGIEILWYMVQNYLNLAKIEEGKIKLKCEPLDIQNIIEEVITVMQPQFAEKQMKVICKSSVPPPQRIVSGDTKLLHIVFNNLFGNAIKYGKRGTAIIYAIKDENNWLKFSVFNQGQGVPREYLGRIFQKFIFYPRKNIVKGLGLYISEWIIENHGGKIWAESEPGKWFEVIFTLPKGGKIK